MMKLYRHDIYAVLATLFYSAAFLILGIFLGSLVEWTYKTILNLIH